MTGKPLCAAIMLVLSLPVHAGGIRFGFRHRKGDSSSYISSVREKVFCNGVLHHEAEIINRIASSVKSVDEDGSAVIEASYMTTENSVVTGYSRSLAWVENTTSIFIRARSGEMTVSDSMTMPTVRNVPVFPDRELLPGDTWTAAGKEVHDLRASFGMDSLLVIPFTASYRYAGRVKHVDSEFDLIEVGYDFYTGGSGRKDGAPDMFSAASGYSRQNLYWDSARGILDHYDEEFLIKIADIRGNVYEFTGTAGAEVTEFVPVNNDDTVRSVRESVDRLALTGVSVIRGDRGLTISLDNIKFRPDSAVLEESEKDKLRALAGILSGFPNDLLVTGHCADRGTEAARLKLSERRAEAVASFLESLGVRDGYHIFTQGKGSSEPAAPNDTEAGRSRNRRVEITVLD